MTNKKAFVTGASEGLGREFSRQLAAKGYAITAVARNEARLQELMEELPGSTHDYLVADLGQDTGVGRCANRLQDGQYDLLVNNAGYSNFGEFDQAKIEDEEKILAVNCQAVMVLSHAYLKNAKSGGALINLSSITNFFVTPIQPTYCATKSFIASFSESLWYQQRKSGVYVQGLCPGVTKTEFLNRVGNFDKKNLMDIFSRSPEFVIRVSLQELEKRSKPIVIPGVEYKLLALVTRLLPRKAIAWFFGKVGELA